MGDVKVSGGAPVLKQPIDVPVDDKIKKILNDPGTDERTKVISMELAFSKLSEADKKQLYDRLKDRTSRDPLAKLFHYRLSHSPAGPGQLSSVDQALRALNSNHGQPTDARRKGPEPGKGPSPSILDPKITEQRIRDALKLQQTQEKKTDFGPEIQVWTKDVLKTPEEKTKIVRSRLEQASKDDLQKIMTQSANWPAESRKIVDEAMRGSQAVMKRIAKDIPADAQKQVMDRVLERSNNLPQIHPLRAQQDAEQKMALRSWMENAPQKALNKVFNKHYEALLPEIRDQLNSGKFGVFDKIQDKGFILGTLDLNPGVLNVAFNRMNSKDKNFVIDTLQSMSREALPKVLTSLAHNLDWKILDGLNKENAEAIRQAYQSLAERAETKAEADLLRKNADYLKGWIEENFKARTN